MTGARGLMIGRGAIRNPWMFRQIRQHLARQPVIVPRGGEVLDYIHRLYEAVTSRRCRRRCRYRR
ncbi:tRNA-dihydrouridine synthase [Verrucomicrobium spinosum]|uniref:tRNA-dihydrouridine synthase n=1 Tax=Verrucomicrobium spinosum TaxID=2736 RepID=UPI00210AF0D7|nr:tRNA-dihydrouridine synthase [Verrucomicrobium spinosum]